MMPFLSVIIPVYNAEHYLEECVQSILQQNFTDFELILVDDGSVDSSGRLCDEFSKNDNRVTTIHQPNRGLVNARRTGIEKAEGEFITFVDADDYLTKSIFEELFNIYTNYKPDIIVFDYYVLRCGEKSQFSQRAEGGFFEGDSLKSLFNMILYSGGYYHFGINPVMWNKWIKRELFEDSLCVPDRIRIGEDVAYSFPMMLRAKSIYYAREKYGYVYRIQDLSMTQSDKPRSAEEYIILFDYLYEKLYGKIDEQQILYYVAWMIASFVGIQRKAVKKGKYSFGKLVKDLKMIANSSIGKELGQKYSIMSDISDTDRLMLDSIYKGLIKTQIKSWLHC